MLPAVKHHGKLISSLDGLVYYGGWPVSDPPRSFEYRPNDDVKWIARNETIVGAIGNVYGFDFVYLRKTTVHSLLGIN